MQKKIIIIIVIIIVIFLILSALSNMGIRRGVNLGNSITTQGNISNKSSSNILTVSKTTSSLSASSFAVGLESAGKYLDYDSSELKTDKKNVLFFHAPWCPTCSLLNKNINSTLSMIPADVNIHKVDYDSNRELRIKYGITYQHTLVLVDENGEMKKKWSGSSDLNDILDNIK